MKAIKFITAIVFIATVFSSCSQSGRYVVLSGIAQGGNYAVKYCSSGVSISADEVSACVDSILREIDFTLSGYNKGSLLSRLNAGERIVPNKMLEEVYDLSYSFYESSDGAFDAACGPLFNIWGFGFSRDSLPGPDKVHRAASISGMGRLRHPFSACIGQDGMLSSRDLLKDPSAEAPVLNFNAIAQGYTSDVIAAYLHSIGVNAMLVDIGEIYCEGMSPSGSGWRIGIDSPFDGNDAPGTSLKGVWDSEGKACGIVTSGNYRKYYVKDGRKYAHTIDPRSAYPVQHGLLSATVVAQNAARADALATICMVIGPQKAQELICSDPDVEGCLISSSADGGMSVWTSDGFNSVK